MQLVGFKSANLIFSYYAVSLKIYGKFLQPLFISNNNFQ